MDAARRKCSEKLRNNSWHFLHDNAPAHRSDLVKDFSIKDKVTTLQHPPYSPELVPSNFPVPSIKLTIELTVL
jgi:transposase